MPTSIRRDGKWWDIVVSRNGPTPLVPVWVYHYDHETKQEQKLLLCQVLNMNRLGWSVVVNGEVTGPRGVDGFKTRWQAIEYAIKVRVNIQDPWGDDAIEEPLATDP